MYAHMPHTFFSRFLLKWDLEFSKWLKLAKSALALCAWGWVQSSVLLHALNVILAVFYLPALLSNFQPHWNKRYAITHTKWCQPWCALQPKCVWALLLRCTRLGKHHSWEHKHCEPNVSTWVSITTKCVNTTKHVDFLVIAVLLTEGGESGEWEWSKISNHRWCNLL